MRNTSLCILEQTAALRFPSGVSRKRKAKSLYYLFIIHSTGKRWRPYSLPQYLVNLTQPIGAQKIHSFEKFVPVLTHIMYVRFEDFRAFLCVFMSVFRGFVRLELWVKVSVAIFFPCGGLKGVSCYMMKGRFEGNATLGIFESDLPVITGLLCRF